MKLSFEFDVNKLSDRELAELAKEVFTRMAQEPMYVTQQVMESMDDDRADEFQANVKMATQAIWG